jgi:hypothetical protein
MLIPLHFFQKYGEKCNGNNGESLIPLHFLLKWGQKCNENHKKS